MAPKKSTPRNAFYFFMVNLQKTQGRQYTGGLREVSVAAGPIWDSMSASERQPFELLARRERSGVKYTTQGQTFDEVIQAQKELKEKEELMQSTIKNTLIQLGRNTGFVSAPFFLVHVNFFCKKDDGTFYPAEFALTAFSIARGVQRTYHTIVDLGDLPQGYTLKAMDHGKDTHQIPLPPNVPHGVKDSNELMERIHRYVYQYIDADETMPPFYTLNQFIPSTDNMMARWAVDYGRSSDYFRIFPLEQLLFDMKMFSLKPENKRPVIRGVRDDGFLHLATAQSILQEDLFMYRQNISCDFHEESDNTVHCSKSYVIRWGWTLANHLCCNMDVRMIPGQHCPKDTLPDDLWVDVQGLQDLAIAGEPGPIQRGRKEHPPSRAYGRGVPLKVTPDFAAETGRGSICPTLLAQPACGAAASQHSETGDRKLEAEQFEDAQSQVRPSPSPSKSANRPKYDGYPLRLPNPQTTAQAESLAQQAFSTDQSPGASFSAEDFPAIGRGNGSVPHGCGRRTTARGSRGSSRGTSRGAGPSAQ